MASEMLYWCSEGCRHLVKKFPLKHYWQQIVRVKTWQLLVIALLLTIISATFLRLNNLGMVERRSAVIKADESGDKTAIKASLVELQHFMSSHMNTQMNGGIYLSKSYERDRTAVLEAANNASNPQSAVYQQASVECRAKWQGGVESFRNDYVQCVIDRVSSLSSASAPTVKLPKVDNYRHDFSSPLWSPDMAGLFVLLTGVTLIIIVVRVLSSLILSVVVRRRYQAL